MLLLRNVSVNSNWVHPPGQPPGISSKNLPGGSGCDFEKLPRGREFDKGRDFVENESETSKNCVDQIFTGEKKQVEFLTIYEVYVFSQWDFASSIGQFFGSAVTYNL